MKEFQVQDFASCAPPIATTASYECPHNEECRKTRISFIRSHGTRQTTTTGAEAPIVVRGSRAASFRPGTRRGRRNPTHTAHCAAAIAISTIAAAASASSSAAVGDAHALLAHRASRTHDVGARGHDAITIFTGLSAWAREFARFAFFGARSINAFRIASTRSELIGRAVAIVIETVADFGRWSNGANARDEPANAVLDARFACADIRSTWRSATWIAIIDGAIAIVVDAVALLGRPRNAAGAYVCTVDTRKNSGLTCTHVRSAWTTRINGRIVRHAIAIVVEVVAYFERRAFAAETNDRSADALHRPKIAFTNVRTAHATDARRCIVDHAIAVVVDSIALFSGGSNCTDANERPHLTRERSERTRTDVARSASTTSVDGCIVDEAVTVVVFVVADFSRWSARGKKPGHLEKHVFEVVVAAAI